MRYTHGLTNSAEYRVWASMIQRCQNPKSQRFSSYGGRGISVCERWQKFEGFFADMGVRPSPEFSIDRIDNDEGYSKENCRWATRSQQQKNKTIYNGQNLKRGSDHWTHSEKEKAKKIAEANIRKAHKSGEENSNAKATYQLADQIRNFKLKNPGLTMAEIGNVFGLGRETVRKIVRGISWVS